MTAEPDTNPDIRWYFDFISPFAYFQHEILKVIKSDRPDIRITPVPVLFAGLLQHHQHKGPAEIEPKRSMTYRYCAWYAGRHGIPFHMPAVHPFNPLPFLRLSISRDNDPRTVDRLFRHIWVESADNPDFATLGSIQGIKGFEKAGEETSDQRIKDRLRTNTEEALQNGVFGVPTLRIDGENFWGVDMTEMALAYHDDRSLFDADEFHRIDNLPGVNRTS